MLACTPAIAQPLSARKCNLYSSTETNVTGHNIWWFQVVVFGGSGFVGQNVCQAALMLGAEVVSINRSGAPAAKKWVNDVRWVQGDIFQPDNYTNEVGWPFSCGC